ncbi:MAG: DUF1127 domain-containing protein [Roseovarius sp.]
MAFVTQNTTGLSALTLDISGKIYHVFQSVENYRNYRKTLNELSSLNARQLADLGLNRSNLRATAHEAIYGA